MKEIKFLFDVDFKQLNCEKILFINDMKMYTDGVNKSILFRIKNKFSQPIDSITLKIVQFSKDEIVLKREAVTISNQIFKKKQNVLIKDLINVDISTQRIEIEIISIKYINLIYENGTIYSTSMVSKNAPSKKDEATVKAINGNKALITALSYILVAVAVLVIISFILLAIFDHTIFESILDFQY